jgi:H+/Cl- antiporter ClcA
VQRALVNGLAIEYRSIDRKGFIFADAVSTIMSNLGTVKKDRLMLEVGIMFIIAGIVCGFLEWVLYPGAVIDFLSDSTYPPGTGLFLLALPAILTLVGIGAVQAYFHPRPAKTDPKPPPPP